MHFALYHYVLNRARWSSRRHRPYAADVDPVLFAPTGAVVIGIDDKPIATLLGPTFAAPAIATQCAPRTVIPLKTGGFGFGHGHGSRSMDAPTLASSFLTILAPSGNVTTPQYTGPIAVYKKLTDWARQAILQVRRTKSAEAQKLLLPISASRRSISFATGRHHVSLVTAARRQSVRAAARTPPRDRTDDTRDAGCPKLSNDFFERKDALDQAVHALLVWR